MIEKKELINILLPNGMRIKFKETCKKNDTTMTTEIKNFINSI
jgi:hypothetical protein